MDPLSELEDAQMRVEAREMYNDLGAEGCLECIAEGITFFNILMMIIYEERNEKSKDA